MKTINEIDSMAVNLRNELGEDSMSPIDIFSIAKTLENLTLVLYPLGKNISGMCIKSNGANLIAINSGMSLGRQRFSIAHEFYHLRYDSDLKKTYARLSLTVEMTTRKKQTCLHLIFCCLRQHFIMPLKDVSTFH